MKVVDWHPEELIDKHLEGHLSPGERVELDAHLVTCVACRFEAQVMRDLEDDEAAVAQQRSKDVLRLVRAATPSRPEVEAPPRAVGPRSPRGGRAAMVAGALLLLAGSAAALWRASGAPQQQTPESVAPPSVSSAADRAPNPAFAAPSVAEPPAASEDTPPSPAASSAVPPSLGSAATLFASANAARRAGKREAALALYHQLQAQYPESPEAKLSQATVGRMMLEEDPAAALEAYEGYLNQGDGGVKEEALVGRALALQRLGRGPDERAAWQELLARYPNSVHASRARARLAELSAAE